MGLAYRFRGSVYHHHGGKHDSKQAGVVLEELRVLHLDAKAAEGNCPLWAVRRELRFHTGQSLSRGDLRAHLHSDTLPSTWPHLLIVKLSVGQAFKHRSLWGP